MVVLLTDVKLAADDRLDRSFGGSVIKGNCTENVAMIGHGNRFLPNFGYAFDQFFDIAGPVEQRVVGMQMKVGKLGHRWRVRHLDSNRIAIRRRLRYSWSIRGKEVQCFLCQRIFLLFSPTLLEL